MWSALTETAARGPERLALVRGDERLTFGAWHRRALDYRAFYLSRGLGPGERVALWLGSSPEMAAALAGVWAAGGVVVLLDANERAAHLAHALALTGARLLVRPSAVAVPEGLDLLVVETGEVPVRTEGEADGPRARPTDPASIVLTSGSTGRPKGVTQTHGSLLRACRAVGRRLDLSAEDRILCPVPWSFDYGYGQLLSTLVLGAAQVLPAASHPQAVCEAVAREQPTLLAGMPSFYAYLLQGLSPIRDTARASIRTLTNTGAALSHTLLEELLAVFPAARLFLCYGLSESYRTAMLDPERVRERPASVGRALPGAEVLVVDSEGRRVAPGEEGEIVHCGDYLFTGYWGDPQASAAALRPDPRAQAGGPAAPALFTGDYGHLDDEGLLYFHQRRDRLLKPMGVRVNPGEVEELLLRSGLLREAAVFGRKQELLGDELWAAVVPREPLAGLASQLARYCRTAMSPYMAPRRYLVKADLPRTRTGKTDYPALQAEASAGELPERTP